MPTKNEASLRRVSSALQLGACHPFIFSSSMKHN
jgi:hypothetical protein